MHLRIWLAAALSALASPGWTAQCEMALSFSQTNVNAKSGVTPVWRDDKAAEKKPLFFVSHLNVNTDGTRRSYSVEDFWGETKAINNLCNAMEDACSELPDEPSKRARRILTQKAFADGWPLDQLEQTRILSTIIPFKNKKPCPPVDGYLVSATSLHKPKIEDVCDITNYVDALAVPALVLPKRKKTKVKGEVITIPTEFEKRGAAVGDIVVALVPGKTEPVYGVVGDSGPWNKLGEASVAMNGKLLELTREPKNYHDVRDNWVVPTAAILILPQTRDADDPLLTNEHIEKVGKPLFDKWGGVGRLAACHAKYTPKKAKK